MKILVTGGASGLGSAIVRKAARDANNVVYFTYASSADKAGALAAEFPGTTAFHCDFTSAASVDAFIAELQGLDIDVLVNNAYVGMSKEHFHKNNEAVFTDSFTRNVVPTLRVTQEVLKIFRKKKAGRIINILTSALLNKPPVGYSEYVANKAYLLSMSKSWATEYGRLNITSNSISPAFMETNFSRYTDERIVQQIKDEHPLKAILSVEEVAEAVAFYFNCSRHINGTNLVINAAGDIG